MLTRAIFVAAILRVADAEAVSAAASAEIVDDPPDETCALQKEISKHTDKGVYGVWTVHRVHENQWRTLQHDAHFCGKSTDTFSLGYGPSRYCRKNFDSEGYSVFNQDGVMVTPGWFCTNQAKPRINSTTFVADTHCEPLTSIYGLWTITRKCGATGKTIEENFCGFKNAEFKIHPVASKYCKKKQDVKTGWAVVNQYNDMELWPWYCTNQCKPEITSSVFREDFSCALDEDKADVIDEEDENVYGINATNDDTQPDCPHGLPAVNTQGSCQDIPNPYMEERGNPCTKGWITRKRCNNPANTHLEYWNKCQFCAKSCAKAGFGYEGLDCTA